VRAPTRETTVEGENERSESQGRELRRRKRKPQIGLGKEERGQPSIPSFQLMAAGSQDLFRR
jgi:hypothetical protein